jgi:glucan biosynthesis protein
MIMAAMQAHIAEHLGFHYRTLVEKQMGVPLPPPDEKLPDDVEVQLSRLIAQASAQVMQTNMAQAQQAQAQQLAQDPLIQMQQQELQIKGADQQRKAQKDQVDAQLKASQQQIERERIQSQKDIDMLRLQADATKSKEELDAHNDLERQRILTNLVGHTK